ncbi:hypothetical protein, partial [Agrobacterium pusense]|uniref:hypothetical protein n=1 Tax=Agrobacterium pusense TaxID=648995 RepID=UPI00289FFA13
RQKFHLSWLCSFPEPALNTSQPNAHPNPSDEVLGSPSFYFAPDIIGVDRFLLVLLCYLGV